MLHVIFNGADNWNDRKGATSASTPLRPPTSPRLLIYFIHIVGISNPFCFSVIWLASFHKVQTLWGLQEGWIDRLQGFAQWNPVYNGETTVWIGFGSAKGEQKKVFITWGCKTTSWNVRWINLISLFGIEFYVNVI